MRPESATVERKAAWIASRAHGVVTRSELLAAGASEAGIKRRVRKGLLIPEYRGVYRVGHRAPSVEARYMAAVKACGKGAVLSGKAAGYILGLLKCSIPPPPEVTGPMARRVEGLKTRQSKHLEATKVRGIPVTTVPRTLVDLAAELGSDELARACHEAGVRYRTTPRHVEAVLARRPQAKGAAALRGVMRGEIRVSLSKLESRFLDLLRAEGLPLPQTNRVVGEHRVDCRWPEYALTVELDSYSYHGSRQAWQADRERERAAYARDDEHRRYTYADVFEDPTAMLRELRGLLVKRRRRRAG